MAALQRSGAGSSSRPSRPAICLLGVNCSSHLGYLQKVLTFADDNPGYQELVRAAAAGLGAIAIKGNAEALEILFDAGHPVDGSDSRAAGARGRARSRCATRR